MNARFWIVCHGSPVKLTFRPGQSLDWYHGAPHEEGWSSESHIWRFDGEYVTVYSCTDGRDCDGRLTHYNTSQCRLDALDARSWEWLGVIQGTPDWEPLDSSQRDEFAEAAGY